MTTPGTGSPAPLIIEAAINGGTQKERNPNVPRSPAEIGADALACFRAGASIVHNHNDDPVLGGSGAHDPGPYLEAWQPILREWPHALLYPTMAGSGPHTSAEERYGHVVALAKAGLLRLGIIDPGSLNLGGAVYQNPPGDIQYIVDTCRDLRLAPSLSIFEPGFLRAALNYHESGQLPPGSLVKLYFGGARTGFGLPPTQASLDAYLRMLDGTGLPWSAAVIGGDVFAGGFAQLVLERGGHLRVGLEDYAGPDTPSNIELVRAAVDLANRVGRPVANSEGAAQLLGMPSI